MSDWLTAIWTPLWIVLAFVVGWFAGTWNEERKWWAAMARLEGERQHAEKGTEG
jgi:hypothetical protein